MSFVQIGWLKRVVTVATVAVCYGTTCVRCYLVYCSQELSVISPDIVFEILYKSAKFKVNIALGV